VCNATDFKNGMRVFAWVVGNGTKDEMRHDDSGRVPVSVPILEPVVAIGGY
jgi:hypothetical protein